jgi:hypothetical protein
MKVLPGKAGSTFVFQKIVGGAIMRNKLASKCPGASYRITLHL